MIEIRAQWGNRPEDRDACARRVSQFMTDMQQANPGGKWCFYQGQRIGLPNPETVAGYQTQSISDVSGQPIEHSGWGVSFHGVSAEHPKPLVLRVTCGAWSGGNNVELVPYGKQSDRFDFNYETMSALTRAFEPDSACVYSPEAWNRSIEAKKQARASSEAYALWPIVDWMVYIAEAQIPASELPMVHRVEHTGSGTLVILKKERLHLNRPEDLALVEAVEPVIRRYQKPPLPKQTHYPKQGAQH